MLGQATSQAGNTLPVMSSSLLYRFHSCASLADFLCSVRARSHQGATKSHVESQHAFMVNIQGKTSEDGKLQPWQESRGMAPPRETTAEKSNELVQAVVATCSTFWGRHHATSIRGHIQQVSEDKCLKTKHGFATFNSTRPLAHGDHQQVPVCQIARAPSTCQAK